MTTCKTCGTPYNIGDWPICGGDPSQHAVPSGSFRPGDAQTFSPVVVFKDRNGQLSYPGSNKDQTPNGYERVEINTTRGVRQLQKRMDTELKIEHEMVDMVEENAINKFRKTRRERLREKMKKMTPQGRQFAELAMKKTDEKPKKSFRPASYIESFEYDKSNREAHNDAVTGWKDRA